MTLINEENKDREKDDKEMRMKEPRSRCQRK